VDVLKVAQILADKKKMKKFAVHQSEFFDFRPGARVENGEA
jgi:hypothetical protein